MAPLDNMSVLDVGCGTGILAIGALLLGAERAVAFDIDPEAAAACGSNAKLNGVHDQVDIFCGGFQALAAGTGFDLILANIYGDIILDLARGIAGKLNSDGTVILSGIAYEHMTDVRKAFENLDLKQTTNRLMDEYVTMTWVKSAPRSL
jgi:ribosomal protein L11 methyltransferase